MRNWDISDVARRLTAVTGSLNDSIRKVMCSDPPGEVLTEYKRTIGNVYGILLMDLLEPILRVNPQLRTELSDPPRPAWKLDVEIATVLVALMKDIDGIIATLADEDRQQLAQVLEELHLGMNEILGFVATYHPEVVKS
jgi:hypothetical protein